jgi:hypothetical protein
VTVLSIPGRPTLPMIFVDPTISESSKRVEEFMTEVSSGTYGTTVGGTHRGEKVHQPDKRTNFIKSMAPLSTSRIVTILGPPRRKSSQHAKVNRLSLKTN